jgi:putative membrane protein
MEQITVYLGGVPAFLSYFGTAVVMTLVYATIYTRVTPHNEIALIKDNVTAASVAFSGSLLGFVLPMASAVANSISLVDCLLWGIVAMIVQILAFLVVRLFIPRISERISNGEVAAGLWLAAASLAAGILNAASMTY